MRLFALSALIILSVATGPSGYASESATDVLAEAQKIFKQANKMQGAWVTTKKLIKKAQTELKKGNKKLALKLAGKARAEARMSLAQAKEQSQNWSEPDYIKR